MTATMLEIPPIPVIQENVQASITIIDVVESTWSRSNVKTYLKSLCSGLALCKILIGISLISL